MEHHKKCLENKCRVCGNKPKGYIYKKESVACQKVLSSVLGLDVTSEPGEIYPSVVCNRCYATLKELDKAMEKGIMRETNLNSCSWLPHSEDCPVCSMVSLGGKPKRRKMALEVQGRPSCNDVNRAIVERVSLLTTHLQNPQNPIHPSYFLPSPMVTDLMCLNCKQLALQPLEVSTCQHYLCVPCIIKCYEDSSILSCSCGSGPVTAYHLRLPPPVVMKVLNGLLVRCVNGCREVMEFEHLHQHITSKCAVVNIPPTSKVTVDLLLHAPDPEGRSQMETETIGLLVEKLLPANGSITVKSNSGKVLHRCIHKWGYLLLLHLAFITSTCDNTKGRIK